MSVTLKRGLRKKIPLYKFHGNVCPGKEEGSKKKKAEFSS